MLGVSSPLHFYLSSYSENYLKICKRASVAYCHFKTLLSQTGALSEIFQSIGGFVELGHFDKHFVSNTEKDLQVKILVFFPRYS